MKPPTQMMTQVADNQSTRVIAEAVETEAERGALLELGARWGQGYLIGRPEIADA